MTRSPLRQGDVLWATLGPGTGREQAGRRPCVVISGQDYIDAVTTLVMIVPITTTDRGWSNHVVLQGTTQVRGLAMTEQPMTISRERIHRHAGSVSDTCLDEILAWVLDFMDAPRRREQW